MSFKSVLIGISLIALTFVCNDTFAAPPANGGPGGQGGCVPGPCVPIDGGISLLVAAGVALGGKKIHEHFKG